MQKLKRSNNLIKDVCYVDMDQTLCNYKKLYKEYKKNNPEIEYPQSQSGFFEKLEPIADSIESYFELKKKFNVFVLSSPSYHNPMSYTEKRLWIEKHLGFNECENLILSCDKTLLMGKYLIDDMKQTGVLLPSWEHIQIWCDKFPTWKSVLNYLM